MPLIEVTGTAMAVEEIAWKYRLEALGGDRRRAAELSGYVERIYEANPGLAEKGPLISVGTTITMPAIDTNPTRPSNALWG